MYWQGDLTTETPYKFETREEAIAAGYVPCGNCSP
jgi:hypothetical protein